MTKTLVTFVFLLCLYNLRAQPKNIESEIKYSKKWSNYQSESLFSTINADLDSAVGQILFSKKFGIINYIQKPVLVNGIPISKVTIKFSFESFSSCLAYLQYKNFDLTTIQKYYARFRAKYKNCSNMAIVSSYDYYLFKKEYFRYVSKLSKSKKYILEDYINFFESQKAKVE